MTLLVISMLGCTQENGSATTTAAPYPTITPTAVPLNLAPITTLKIPGYVTFEPQPTADGFLFQKLAKAPGAFVGTLYRYVAATQQVTVLDTAQPIAGNNRDIRLVAVAGNTVAYIKSDNNLDYWGFWMLNLSTGQKTLLDSYHLTQGINGAYPSNFALDADHIVWSTLTTRNGKQGSFMQVYDIASGKRTEILSDFASSPPTIFRPAIAGNVITYTKLPYGASLATSESIWRVGLDGSHPQQMTPTTTANVNISMSATYVAWDELTNEDRNDTIHVVKLDSNQEIKLPFKQCIRPVVYGHFVACVDLAKDTGAYLFDVQSGRWANFGSTQGIAVVTLTADRIFWSDANQNDAEWMAYPTS
jgi:hypothetical protein